MKTLKPFLGRRPLTRYAENLVVKILEGQFKREIPRSDVIHYSGRPNEFLYKAIRNTYNVKSTPIYITPHIHLRKSDGSKANVEEYMRLSGVIALTDVEKKWLIKNGVNASKVHTIGHAVTTSGKGSPQNFQSDYNLAEKKVVLYLGRQTEDKGFFRLLDCIDTVWETLNDTIFILAGPEPSRDSKVKSKYAKLFDDKRVINLGLVSENQKEDLLATCDILCLPSTVEAFGLVYMEAWSYGKPTVALDIPAVAELHSRSGAGLVVENDPLAIAEALIKLLSDGNRYQKMSRSAADFSKNKTWKRVAQDMIKVYQGRFS